MGSRDDRVKLSATVDFGQAELLPDPRNLTGWRLLVDGVDQSYVDLGDPLRLDMMYARLLCSVVDAAGVPGGRLRALHLGAGGLTVARYAAAARPGSTQLA
ncbi:MAG: hypothetical protein ACRDXX_04140, partial [Stackebrandtia sp.]